MFTVSNCLQTLETKHFTKRGEGREKQKKNCLRGKIISNNSTDKNRRKFCELN